MDTRNQSECPIKDPRNIAASGTSSRNRIISPQVPANVKNIRSFPRGQKHLQNPLTPLTRLKKFKEIRDRNLRRATVKDLRIADNKMSIDMEIKGSENCGNVDEIKTDKEKHKQEKVTNGADYIGKNVDEVQGSPKKNTTVLEENGEEVRSSKKDRKTVTETEQKSPIISESKVDENHEEKLTVNKNNIEEKDEEEIQTEIPKISLPRNYREPLSMPSTSTAGTPLSPETIQRLRGDRTRVHGRRSIRCNRKRKLESNWEDDEIVAKKEALQDGGSTSSPSFWSPRWISLPFKTMWPSKPSPTPYSVPQDTINSPPYRSPLDIVNRTTYRTPFPDSEDSMAVNIDNESFEEFKDFDDESITLSQPKPSVWSCNIM